jgi:hypothetical protein
MRIVRESPWLPAVVLAVGIALTLAILTAADRAAPAAVGPSAYPAPCLYLPLIKQPGATGSAPIEEDAVLTSSAPSAYPLPGVCELRIPKRTYLPIMRR